MPDLDKDLFNKRLKRLYTYWQVIYMFNLKRKTENIHDHIIFIQRVLKMKMNKWMLFV